MILCTRDKIIEKIKTYTSTIGMKITYNGIQEIADRSRGNPELSIYYIKCIQSEMTDKDGSMVTLYLILRTFRNMRISKDDITSSMYQAKEEKTVSMLFHRSTKSKKPSISSLKMLQKKIDQINNGKFKYDSTKFWKKGNDQ